MSWSSDDERRVWTADFRSCVAAIIADSHAVETTAEEIVEQGEGLADLMATVRARRFGAVDDTEPHAHRWRCADCGASAYGDLGLCPGAAATGSASLDDAVTHHCEGWPVNAAEGEHDWAVMPRGEICRMCGNTRSIMRELTRCPGKVAT